MAGVAVPTQSWWKKNCWVDTNWAIFLEPIYPSSNWVVDYSCDYNMAGLLMTFAPITHDSIPETLCLKVVPVETTNQIPFHPPCPLRKRLWVYSSSEPAISTPHWSEEKWVCSQICTQIHMCCLLLSHAFIRFNQPPSALQIILKKQSEDTWFVGWVGESVHTNGKEKCGAKRIKQAQGSVLWGAEYS